MELSEVGGGEVGAEYGVQSTKSEVQRLEF